MRPQSIKWFQILAWIGVGFGLLPLLLGVAEVGFERISNADGLAVLSGLILPIFILIGLAVLIPMIARGRNGTARWVFIGIVGFAVLIALLNLATAEDSEMPSYVGLAQLVQTALLIGAAIFLLQPDANAWLVAGVRGGPNQGGYPAAPAYPAYPGAVGAATPGPNYVFISHAPQDAVLGDHIARDLERQGVNVWIASRQASGASQALSSAAAVVAIVSPASAHSPAAAEWEQAQRAGVPVYPVRIAEFDLGELPGLGHPSLRTDAFGPAAEGNVARLAAELRERISRSDTSRSPALGHGAPPSSDQVFPPRQAGGGALAMKIILPIAGVIMIIVGATQVFGSGLFGGGSSGTSRTSGSATGGSIALNDTFLKGTWQKVCGEPAYMRIDPASGSIATHNQPAGATYARTEGTIRVAGSPALTVYPTGPGTMNVTVNGQSVMLIRCAP